MDHCNKDAQGMQWNFQFIANINQRALENDKRCCVQCNMLKYERVRELTFCFLPMIVYCGFRIENGFK